MTEETIVSMTPPTLELVEHALRELEWDDRLTLYKMTSSAGNTMSSVYNLPSAVRMLLGTNWDAPLLEPGYKGGLTWVDVADFVRWLRDSVQDAELADAVESRVQGLDSYMAQVNEMRVVFTERMDQYREVRAAAQAAPVDGESAEQ